MKTLLPLLFLLLALPSCRSVRETATTQKTVIAARTDTQNAVRTVRDTLLFHDSIYIKEWRGGDTVFLTKNVLRLRYRDRWRTDTFYKATTDTVRVTDYAWREKETASVAQRIRTALAAALITALALAIIYALFLFLLRRKE